MLEKHMDNNLPQKKIKLQCIQIITNFQKNANFLSNTISAHRCTTLNYFSAVAMELACTFFKL